MEERKRYRDLWGTEVKDQQIKSMIEEIMVSSDDEKIKSEEISFED